MRHASALLLFFLVLVCATSPEVFAARPYTASDYLDSFEKAKAPAEQESAESLPSQTTYEGVAPQDSEATSVPGKPKATTLPGGQVKISGSYRLAGGIDNDFILNDSNANQNMYYLQGPNSRYISGERLNNTFDPAIYSQHVVNIDFSPSQEVGIHMQVVNDPWSWVGTTGEQVQLRPDVSAVANSRYNLKYIGANNSTIGEVYRTSDGDRINFPQIKIHDGQTTRTHVEGLDALLSPDGDKRGVGMEISQLQIDYEYRPIRKLWVDYKKEEWQTRFFALADENQALSSDDLLGLSNHKDYWEPSPWIYQYRPIQHFTDAAGVETIKRGYYSDNLAVQARDSQGNRLVLLRGISLGAHSDDAWFAATVAAPFTPWDKHYFDADNIPGAVRAKRFMNDRWMLGGTYGFRLGRVDERIADKSQVFAVDTSYQITEDIALKGETAFSSRQKDQLETGSFQGESDGNAVKALVERSLDRPDEGHTDMGFSYAHMTKRFESPLSRYTSTRNDKFWGNHIQFFEKPDVEPFRIGDGLDTNRFVFRFNWSEKRHKDKFYNLFDVRNVHRTSDTRYLETVWREEMTYKINDRLTAKGLLRWRDLPKTTANIEPSLTSFYFPLGDVDPTDFTIRNTAVRRGQNADQFTASAGLQAVVNPRWTAEGIVELTNAVPDFPRGLLSDVFKDANDRIDGILNDRMKVFLYGQSALGGAPPYPYFHIVKGRLINQRTDNLKLILHATSNGYKPAGGIDDNITHMGLSASYDYSKKWSFFADYTVSWIYDVPKLIASNYAAQDYGAHHNVYLSMDYRLNSATVFRAEYGVFGLGANSPYDNPYTSTTFSLPTIDTEHLLRFSLDGQF